jgi:hypothetical protein
LNEFGGKIVNKLGQEWREVQVKRNGTYKSEDVDWIMKRRQEALEDRDYVLYNLLTKAYNKQREADKKEQLVNLVTDEMDERSKFMGLKSLKSTFQPRPYSRKRRADGSHVRPDEISSEAAKYLAEVQWKEEEGELWREISVLPIFENLEFKTGKPSILELRAAIKRLKRNKTPGPDGIPNEAFKGMDEINLQRLLELIHIWWEEEYIPDEVLEANVALIFKSGDSSDCGNYRPISLLNTINKLVARIIVVRLQEVLDPLIQSTQFGFRPGKSTADAIGCVRRWLHMARTTHDETVMLLLDWEKAFDRVSHGALYKTLKRLGVSGKLISMIKALYRNPVFSVVTDGIESGKYVQGSGIRQGCPRSPFTSSNKTCITKIKR